MKHLIFLAILGVAASAPAQQRQPAPGPWAGCGTRLPGSVPCPPRPPSEFPDPIFAPPPAPPPYVPSDTQRIGKAELDRTWRFECVFCDPPGGLPGSDGKTTTKGPGGGRDGAGNGGGGGGSGSGGGGGGGTGNVSGGAGGVAGGRHNTGQRSTNRWMVFVYPEPRCAVIVAKTIQEAEVQARNKNLPPPRHLLGHITQKGAASAWCVSTPGRPRAYFFVQGQRTDVPSKENAISQARENARAYMARNPGSQLHWVFSANFL